MVKNKFLYVICCKIHKVHQLDKFIQSVWGDKPLTDEMKLFVGKVHTYYQALEKIAEKKTEKSEEELKLSEERFRNMIEAAQDIFYTTDKDGNYTYVNEFGVEKLGFPLNELLTKNYTQLIREDYVKTVKSFYFKQVMAKQKFSYLEFPIITKSGFELWVGQNVQLSYSGGEYNGTQAVVRDITVSKKATEDLKISEERFRNLIQNSLDVITVLDEQGNIMYDSFSVYTQFGYEKPLIGSSVFDFFHPDDLERAKEQFAKHIHIKGITEPMEYRFRTPSGDWRHVEIIGNNLLHDPSIKGIVINSRDITERKKFEKALVESEERFRKLVQYSTDITTVIKADGTIIYESPSFFRLFGYSESLIGKNVFNFLHAEDIQKAMTELGRAIQMGGVSDPIEFRFKTASGDYKYIETIGNNLLTEPSIEGIVLNSREITERKKVEKELVRAKNQAVAAAQAKSDFLSNMSHEIRTPMNAIVGFTNLLIEKGFDKEVMEYLFSIKYSADNLLFVINDILDFSKIESGKISFESIDFNVHELLEDSLKIFKSKADEKGLELKLDNNKDVPQMLVGDPFRLNQILINLIGNAIKFTNKGYVEVSMKTVSTSNNKTNIAFTVKDTGIGIAKDKHGIVFESFNQGYTDISRKFGGTGLGLAITKNLTQLQGGKISLSSTVKVGSAFTVELPFTISTKKVSHRDNDEVGQEKNLSGLRILVVEDNKMNQFVAKQIIEKWNATTTMANNGSEAIQILTVSNFDLVLMDLQMPEMSGYQATEFIRSKSTTVLNPAIPIIALTADAFSETKRKVFEAGMDDFVTKPFNQEELYSKIIKHIRNIK